MKPFLALITCQKHGYVVLMNYNTAYLQTTLVIRLGNVTMGSNSNITVRAHLHITNTYQ